MIASTARTTTRRALAVTMAVLLVAACGNSASSGGAGPGQRDGVSGTEIRVGALVARTGLLGNQYLPITYGVKAYFDLVNGQGGVNGRKLTLAKIRDDATNVARSTSEAR